ncbi:solute carrier family 25 member 40-like isoform X2 [Bradysia coprophila]|uniref:solute carrier family 25 member 40-like isoform X2 n=1 Tax=Bradysia coprophila TaxID=38358 RepID=UPI00187DAC82|nr:solute carrier family 25 member 40-like isoform X2 [Bradysia coprophila]
MMDKSGNNFNMDDARYRIKPYQQIASSCSGAIITSLTMTPLDVVKTRLQVQQKTMLSNKCFVYCNGLMDHLCPCPTNGDLAMTRKQLPYNGTIDAFIKISRNEGIGSLWSGLGPTLVLAIPATVIYFVCYEQLRVRYKEYYLKRFPESGTAAFSIPLLAGMSARVLSVTVVNPLELVRTKMQSEKLSYFQVGKACRTMIAKEGITGLWKGLAPTLYRDVPFSGIYWASYESIKSYSNVVNPTFHFSFGAGAVSGCIAAFVTTPFDVVKTHKQIAFGEKFLYPTDKSNRPDVKPLQMLSNIYRANGFQGLFAGVTPRIIKISPACAIMVATFEYGKSFFYLRNINASRSQSNNVDSKMLWRN